MSTITTRRSWLQPSGGNKFQVIKERTAAAQASGKTILKLSIGQPTGPALMSARVATAKAVMSEEEAMHAYQDNKSDGVKDFAKRFVAANVGSAAFDIVSAEGNMSYLPIPGIKPMISLIPLACGASKAWTVNVMTMTDPGYPTPAFWCNQLPGVMHKAIHLSPENNFRFSIDKIDELAGPRLLMLNYPHNPSGQIADEAFWHEICEYCEGEDIRIWNDAAYAVLAHDPEHRTLTEVAAQYPGLSWAEAFSASKAGNFTGWRIGAMAGSPDFIGDIERIKGDADSGFAAPMAAGIIDCFEKDQVSIKQVRDLYRLRLSLLCGTLQDFGMRLACEPKAGFFSLWVTPKQAFGVQIENSEHFGTLLMERGEGLALVGVDFHPYFRLSVTSDIRAMLEQIMEVFRNADVKY
jgi:LL-diaminopimelate aminotransferase